MLKSKTKIKAGIKYPPFKLKCIPGMLNINYVNWLIYML